VGIFLKQLSSFGFIIFQTSLLTHIGGSDPMAMAAERKGNTSVLTQDKIMPPSLERNYQFSKPQTASSSSQISQTYFLLSSKVGQSSLGHSGSFKTSFIISHLLA